MGNVVPRPHHTIMFTAVSCKQLVFDIYAFEIRSRHCDIFGVDGSAPTMCKSLKASCYSGEKRLVHSFALFTPKISACDPAMFV